MNRTEDVLPMSQESAHVRCHAPRDTAFLGSIVHALSNRPLLGGGRGAVQYPVCGDLPSGLHGP